MPNDKEISVEAVKAIELKPDKKYMLMFDTSAISYRDAAALMNTISDQGIKGIGVMMRGTDGITVIEAPGDKEQHPLYDVHQNFCPHCFCTITGEHYCHPKGSCRSPLRHFDSASEARHAVARSFA